MIRASAISMEKILNIREGLSKNNSSMIGNDIPADIELMDT